MVLVKPALRLAILCVYLANYVSSDSSSLTTGSGPCPYGRPTVKYENEVYTFLTASNMSTWKNLAWNKITTLALFMTPDPELICLAHKHNVRVVTTADFSGKILSNATARQQVIQSTLKRALQYNMDGVNIDFEEPIQKGSPERSYLTLMVEEFSQAFHSKIKGSQVSVDLPYDPDGIYGRWFDAFGIAFACDFIVAMDYDLENFHIAGPNSGYYHVLKGAQRYLSIGIPASKLVLAMPWYGYKLQCASISPKHECIEKGKGVEVGFKNIIESYFPKYATSERLWDPVGLSPYFDMNINGTLEQVRYDDSESLQMKYDIAVKLGLLGVGMWTANDVDYSDTPKALVQRQQMWGAIPYIKPTGTNSYGHAACPYGRPTVKYEHEVFTFLKKSNMSVWKNLDWDKITTIALFMDPNPDIICFAHKHNVKVVTNVDFPVSILSNATARQQVVQKVLNQALQYNMDGVNIDFEEEVSKDSPDREYLTLMVAEISQAFHSKINGSQVSIDLPYDPDGTYDRWYDSFGLAFACDFLVAMDYDIGGSKFAGPNSGYYHVLNGAQRYLSIGVPKSKLVLAMPWYGKRFECSSISEKHECVVKSGVEIDYYKIVEEQFPKYATTSRLWDPVGLSPYFDMNVSGQLMQMRYDDSESLQMKYDIAVKLDLLGVGMFTVNCIDNNDTPQGLAQRQQMWGAIPFTKPTL